MIAQIKRTGEVSAHVIIPKGVLNQLGITIGDYVDIPTMRKLTEIEIQEYKKKGFIR